MSESIEGSYRELHEGVGVAAGGIDQDGKVVPVVTLSFVKDRTAIDDCEGGHYDPDDGRWHNFSMTIRAARQMMSDLKDCIDAAIKGPQ